MSYNFPKAVFVYEVEGLGRFYMCPDCLEFIEGDLCLECGQIYDISIEDNEPADLVGEKVIANVSGGSI